MKLGEGGVRAFLREGDALFLVEKAMQKDLTGDGA